MAQRQQLYADLNTLILDESAQVPVASNPQVLLTSSKLHGGQVDLAWSTILTGVSLS